MSEINYKDYIDLGAALSRLRGNEMLYKRLLGSFLQSKEFETFEENVAEMDVAKAANTVHGIKGMTGNLSLNVVFNASVKLMDELRRGEYNEVSVADFCAAYKNTREAVELYLAQG